MNKEKCVLVCGVGERASAVARRLLGDGYAVAIHQSAPPRTLRRRMSFADAWFDGVATLNAVEARRTDAASEFLLGLQSRQFIPVLRQSFMEIVERWPWDAIVAAPDDGEPAAQRLLHLAEVTIGVGAGFVAGVDCDLVIEADGPDPGAVVRNGSAASRPRTNDGRGPLECWEIQAPRSGALWATRTIGAKVGAGAILGFVGEDEVRAPVAGRIRGLARREQAAVAGAPIVEIALSAAALVAGVSDRNKLIARGVAFAVEMETEGWSPVSFGHND